MAIKIRSAFIYISVLRVSTAISIRKTFTSDNLHSALSANEHNEARVYNTSDATRGKEGRGQEGELESPQLKTAINRARCFRFASDENASAFTHHRAIHANV